MKTLIGYHTLFLTASFLAFLAADFFDGLLTFGGFTVADFIDGIAEFTAGVEAVHFARALALAFDLDGGGDVLEVNTGGSFVDFLTTAA